MRFRVVDPYAFFSSSSGTSEGIGAALTSRLRPYLIFCRAKMYSSVEGRRTTGSFFDFLVSPIMFLFFTSAGLPLTALDIFSRKISKSATTWLKISYREEEEEEEEREAKRSDRIRGFPLAEGATVISGCCRRPTVFISMSIFSSGV